MANKKGTGMAAALGQSSDSQTEQGETESSQKNERWRGKRDVVAFQLRLPRDEWKRLHLLALEEGVSLNTLILRGVDKVFEENGQQPMEIPWTTR